MYTSQTNVVEDQQGPKRKVNRLIEERRIGIFTVDIFAIEDNDDAVLRTFMSNFIITRAEYRYDLQAFEYIAYSALFDVIDQGDIIPVYNITLIPNTSTPTVNRRTCQGQASGNE